MDHSISALFTFAVDDKKTERKNYVARVLNVSKGWTKISFIWPVSEL